MQRLLEAMTFGTALALLAAACDSKTTTAPSPSGAAAQSQLSIASDAPANVDRATTVTVSNEKYFAEGENFPLCDGTYAVGDIPWHEVIIQINRPDGSTALINHYGMAGPGRAIGPDGTEYIVRQVNNTQTQVTPPRSELRGSVRIVLISRGDGSNLFYTVRYTDTGSTFEVECRG